MTIFFENKKHAWEDLGDGITRRIVGHTNELMTVEVCFKKGAIGTVHSHEEHDQIGYILAGSFEVEIDGETKVLEKGDAFVAKKLSKHGVVSLEENSVILDAFSPAREDYLTS